MGSELSSECFDRRRFKGSHFFSLKYLSSTYFMKILIFGENYLFQISILHIFYDNSLYFEEIFLFQIPILHIFYDNSLYFEEIFFFKYLSSTYFMTTPYILRKFSWIKVPAARRLHPTKKGEDKTRKKMNYKSLKNYQFNEKSSLKKLASSWKSHPIKLSQMVVAVRGAKKEELRVKK